MSRKIVDMDQVQLCAEQQAAFDRIENFTGRVIALTGAAGSGKSTVIRHLLNKGAHDYRMTATTGKAALQVGGVTVDRQFYFSRNNWEVRDESVLNRIMGSCPRRIIIDEASMIGYNMASLIYQVAEDYDRILVLVGDWAQAAPVKDRWPFESNLFSDVEFIKLRENHRQDEADYMHALNQLRRGDLGCGGFFESRVVDRPGEGAVILTGTNARAAQYNNIRLKKLVAETGNTTHELFTSMVDYTGYEQDKLETYAEQSGLAHQLRVCKECRVLITRNTDTAVNGDTGVLEDIGGSFLRVRLDRGGVVYLRRITVDVYGANMKLMAKLTGYPMRLGWASTVHKAQGSTLYRAAVETDFRFPTRQHGLMYVALSRTITADGLYLRDWNAGEVYCDSHVLPYI